MSGEDGISQVGIAGGGLMGAGIAEVAARAGLAVCIFEPTEELAENARQRVDRSLAKSVAAGRLESTEADAALQQISCTADIADLGGSDCFIEAVTEDLEIKRAVFAQADDVLSPDALIASNTSSIPIAQLAAVVSEPQRVIGLHFFSPVPAMKLVEIVCSLDTDIHALERAHQLAQRLGKHAVETKDRSGFIVNMLLVPFLMAAVRMAEEGFASREAIDEAMQLGAGHPMGPLALCDLIGLDVLYAIGESLFDEYKRSEYAPPLLVKRMVAHGRLGRKTGRGFYDYDLAASAPSR